MFRFRISTQRLVAGLIAVGLAGGCATTPPDRGSVVQDAQAQLAIVARGLDRAAPPSRNFDLSHWKLTIPSGEDIQLAELNRGYTLAGAFYTDPQSGGMVLRVPNRAGTTKSSSYSRTELREMLQATTSAKSDANNWTPEQGGTLRARLRVDHVSTTGDEDKVGRVVIGQIHGPDSEVIRLYYRKRPDEARGRIYAGLDTVNNETMWSPDIVGNGGDDGIALGEIFSYEIRLRGERLRVVVAQDRRPAAVYSVGIDPRYAGRNLYFKAGVYNQNNTGDADDYVQATFFALERTHP